MVVARPKPKAKAKAKAKAKSVAVREQREEDRQRRADQAAARQLRFQVRRGRQEDLEEIRRRREEPSRSA